MKLEMQNSQAFGVHALACSAVADTLKGGHQTLPLRVRCGGFTLAEVLAALVFMAIVIPVALQGLRIANLAGQVAIRKAEAARVAERVMNESIVTTNWSKSGLSGTIAEGMHQFSWSILNEPWTQDPLHLLSVQVKFTVQNQPYDVRLSTLVDTTQPQ